MVYDIFAHYAKKAAHIGVEYTFPSTPSIAMLSGYGSWCAYRCGITFIPGIIVDLCRNKMGYVQGSITAAAIVPEVLPYASYLLSVGAYFTTSLALNLISIGVFSAETWIKKQCEDKPPQEMQQVKPKVRKAKKIPPVQNPLTAASPMVAALLHQTETAKSKSSPINNQELMPYKDPLQSNLQANLEREIRHKRRQHHLTRATS